MYIQTRLSARNLESALTQHIRQGAPIAPPELQFRRVGGKIVATLNQYILATRARIERGDFDVELNDED